jgi:hypothetical protein
MDNRFGAIKQGLFKKQSWIALLASTLLLFLPSYSWFLIRSYQTTIQIPREQRQFEEQEKQIIYALRNFKIKNHQYPERLAQLAPDYIDTLVENSEKWSFYYGTDDGEFTLAANVPQSWFGWPTRRVCHSGQNETLDCDFRFVCRHKQGIEFLTEPIYQNQSFSQVFGTRQTNPCTN